MSDLSRCTEVEDLNRKGACSWQRGDFAKAENYYRQSLGIQPLQSNTICNLVAVLASQNRIDEAEAIARNGLDSLGDEENLLNHLGHILMLRGHPDEAMEYFRLATDRKAASPLSYYNLASTELQGPNWLAAAKALQVVLSQSPDHQDALRGMGLVYMGLNQTLQAKGYFQKAIQLNPNNSDCWYELGNACLDLEEWKLAQTAYLKTMQLDPSNWHATVYLSQALLYAGEYRRADEINNKLLRIYPGEWRCWYNQGELEYLSGKFLEAIACFERAASLNQSQWEIMNGLGIAYHETGEFLEAEAKLNAALNINKDAADAHWNLGLTLLSMGNFINGWEQYEWRWKRKSFPTKAPATITPMWRGEKGTLCLYTEQGFGDSIQFFRFVRAAKHVCANRVVLFAEPNLVRLFQTSCEIEVISKCENWEKVVDTFDYQLPLMSLPYALKLDSQDYSNHSPYIYTKSKIEVIDQQTELLTAKKNKLGICWQGNLNNKLGLKRSIPTEIFINWLDQISPTFNFFNLQPEQMGQPLLLPSGKHIDTFPSKPKDFAETAAYINALDAVISIDTSIAHLTGAMGKPLFLLLYKTPDWRWINGGNPTLWYPHVKSYTQKIHGDWAKPLKQLQFDLENFAKEYSFENF